ncbi:K+-transporting ATPase C [Acidovorax sp. KKS102]|uniref:potassium-transporting ATPase subunit KdpC n=1 Tax=Acidovorax sp. KKS102 TaxID=358220 RepID=UPI00028B4AE5|nr:potassium-transporting ATPase subunit KdpC [Acidovorax sp. KKS102]AFU46253.1 K+-transporting ATPase C [Acidovorax sp. KKS102]
MPIRIPRDDVPASTGGVLRPALTLFVVLSLITGLLYPLLVTGVAQTAFPHQANGSLITQGGKTVGSELIGQSFTEPGHFWGRPSATAPMPYNAAASGGSNQGPTNPALVDAVKARIEALRAADPGNTRPVPVDLVTASASGLDPQISPAAADYQAARVAKSRGLPLAQVQALVQQHTESPWLGLLGEPRVNVLALNLALESLPKQ